MPILQVRFFGALDLTLDNHPLPKPPTLKSQSLLAYLILHRRSSQPRERLAALFWGDRPDPRARHSLSTALWQIRRCLPSDRLVLCDAQSVQFDPQTELWVDVDEFDSLSRHQEAARLQSAVALYRGDLLADFYDDWIVNERHRLETRYAECLAHLMALQEGDGAVEAALATAQRLLGHDPLREEAHRLVMRAYCRLGRRSEALEQFGRCRQLLQSELGAEPLPETVELQRSIAAGRLAELPRLPSAPRIPPALGPAQAAAHEPGPGAPPRPGRSPLEVDTPGRLWGRERELDRLLDWWRAAQSGRVTAVLVSGEAGVGKTSLVQELARRLRWQGVRVLWGRCYEFERLLPFQPIVEALRSPQPALSPSELDGLPHWARVELARLAPDLLEEGFGVQVPALPPIAEQSRLFAGLVRCLRHWAAGGTLLLVVEDLHWASESTLELLHYLARQSVGHALLLATLRSDEPDPHGPLPAFVREWLAFAQSRSLPLGRLPAQTVQQWIAGLSGAGPAAAPLAERLYRETEGNPFFLTETVKSLFEGGLLRLEAGVWQGDLDRLSQGELPLPTSLRAAITARLEALDSSARQLLRLASVLGREFDFEPLDALWGRGQLATLETLDQLLRRQLIQEASGPLGRDYAFGHHKIQEVVYAGLRGRRLLHRRVVELLAQAPLQDHAALAWHWERAGQPGRAAYHAWQAGLQAKAVFAHAEARAYFDRALALLAEERPTLRTEVAVLANHRLRLTLLGERGWVLRLLGRMDLYDRDLAEVEQLALLVGDDRTLAHLRWRQATTHRWFCRYAQALQAAEEGVRLSLAAGEDALQGLCWREAGMAARGLGRYEHARAALVQALALFRHQGDAVNEVHVLGNLSTLHLFQGEQGPAQHLAQQALARCEQAGLSLERRLPLGDLGAAAAAGGEADLARRSLLQSLSIARRVADRTQEIYCLGHLGWLELRQGREDSALEQLQAALELAETIGSCTEQSWLLSGLAQAHRLAGQADLAADAARRALSLAETTGRAYDLDLARRSLI